SDLGGADEGEEIAIRRFALALGLLDAARTEMSKRIAVPPDPDQPVLESQRVLEDADDGRGHADRLTSPATVDAASGRGTPRRPPPRAPPRCPRRPRSGAPRRSGGARS